MTVLSAAFTPEVGRADSPDLTREVSVEDRRLLEEYKANYERLKETYTTNIRIEAIERRFGFPAEVSAENPAGRKAYHLIYYAGSAGNVFRMDVAPLFAGTDARKGITNVHLATPEGYVMARRKSPGEAFVIVSWNDDPDSGLANLSSYKFQWSPYSCYVLPLEWFIFQQPGFAGTRNIDEVNVHEVDGERLVTLVLSGMTKRPNTGWRSSFVFHRDRAWALKEYTWGDAEPDAPSAEVFRARYEYAGDYQGVPLLKRVEYWRELGPDRKRLANEVFEVQRIQVGPVPDEEFTLESIGLSLGKQRSRWAWRLAAVLATVLVFALLYVVLRRREAIQAQKGAAN